MAIDKKKNWLFGAWPFALSAGLVTFLVYLPALQNGFVSWDDNVYIYDNDHIWHLNGEFFSWAFTDFYDSNWFPLTLLSHAVDYAVWGLNPMGHHLSNILLHSINTLLVTLLTHQLLKGIFASNQSGRAHQLLIALITGLLFGLHPLHVESVAWVSERKDLLCAFFYLSSLLFYLRTWRSLPNGMKLGELFHNQDYLVCLALFVLALMSKPMAVSLPCVLLLLDWLHDEEPIRTSWKDRLVAKTPFFVLALASAIVTIAAQQSGGSITSLVTVPVIDRLWVAGYALIAYLQNMVWPLDLLPYYRYPRSVDWSSIQYLGSALLVIAITTIALLSIRRHRSWAAAWAYYIITLIPVIGIVKVGSQAMADRYMYLPSIAPFMLLSVALVWGLHRLPWPGKWTGMRAVSLFIITISLVGVLSSLTQKQIRIWKNGETLWAYVIQYDDQIPLAYKQLGVSLFGRGQYPAAVEMFNRALSLNPLDTDSLNNLAICYLELGDLDKAMQVVQNALSLEEDAISALNTLGEIYMAREEYPDANKVFFRAMQLEPGNPLRLFNLAVSFDKLNDAPQACIYWRRFMTVDVTRKHDVEIIQHLAEVGCPVTDP